MWKHVLAPVALVILLWLAMNVATTIYISWADRSFQRIFAENVSSVEAGFQLKVASWKLIADAPWLAGNVDEFDLRSRSSHGSMLRAFESLEATAMMEREYSTLVEIEKTLELIASLLSSRRSQLAGQFTEGQEVMAGHLREYVDRIESLATQITEWNQAAIRSSEATLRKAHSQVLWFRNIGLIVGPFLGLVLGWVSARRLQRRVSTLAITLKEVPQSGSIEIGSVDVHGESDWANIQVLAERTVERMRQIDRDLADARRKVIQSERLAAVGELAASLAHELRNPLTSVKLLLQHASRSGHDVLNSSSNRLELILSEIGRMEKTIQGMLDFSRPAQIHLQRHDIRETLQRAVQLTSGQALSNQVVIELDLADEPAWIEGDPEQLHQVFVNLLINAIEAMPKGGTIMITCTVFASRNRIVVQFRDTGPGIKPGVLPRVFEPFVTSKDNGTGLGLAISHRIVLNHGGSIIAGNQQSGGAVFTVELPSVEGQFIRCETLEYQPSQLLAGEKIQNG